MKIKLFKLYKMYNTQAMYLFMYIPRNTQKASEIQNPHFVSHHSFSKVLKHVTRRKP